MKYITFTMLLLLSGLQASATTYSYDNLNRLVTVRYAADKMISYTYDEVGNLLEMVIITPDAPELDSNTNGVPDLWELGFGLQLNFPPGHDQDADGMADTDEYAAGTNPADSNSVFAVIAVSNLANRVVTFASVTGHYYSLEYSTNILEQNWMSVPGATNLPGTGAAAQLEDTVTPTPPCIFYRLRVRWP